MIGASETGRGRVLSFSASSRRQRRRAPSNEGQKGAILLFTGVRYERVDDEPRATLAERASSGDCRLGG